VPSLQDSRSPSSTLLLQPLISVTKPLFGHLTSYLVDAPTSLLLRPTDPVGASSVTGADTE
jgi:hypothetical protein